MPWFNSAKRYGRVAKILHWTIALLFIAQYYWVYWSRWMLPEGSPQAVFYIRNLHKPLGMTIFVLGLLFWFWHLNNIKPAFTPKTTPFERRLAYWVHTLLYVVVLLVPVSGLIMSSLAGYPTELFGLYTIPLFLSKNPLWAQRFYLLHQSLAYFAVLLLILHTAGALKHHFIYRDNVLKRMLPFDRN